MLFQHGLCGDAGQTNEAFPLNPDFRRITVEMRGHGRSEPGDISQFSIQTFADDLAAYIEANLAHPVIVGGISMGAAIALNLAVKRPDLVRGLVLARPAWVVSAAPDNMAPNAEVGRLLAAMSPELAREEFLKGEIARRLEDEAPDNLASLLGFFAREPIAVTSALLTAISSDGPSVTRSEVGSIRMPTLVIGHERDSIHPIGHARAISEMIPGARFSEITPKALDKGRYVHDFHKSMNQFLEEFH